MVAVAIVVIALHLGSRSIVVQIFILPQKNLKNYQENPKYYKMLEKQYSFPLVNTLKQYIGPPKS